MIAKIPVLKLIRRNLLSFSSTKEQAIVANTYLKTIATAKFDSTPLITKLRELNV